MATLEQRKRKAAKQWLVTDRRLEQHKQDKLEAADAAKRSAAAGHSTTAVADRMTAVADRMTAVAGSCGIVHCLLNRADAAVSAKRSRATGHPTIDFTAARMTAELKAGIEQQVADASAAP